MANVTFSKIYTAMGGCREFKVFINGIHIGEFWKGANPDVDGTNWQPSLNYSGLQDAADYGIYEDRASEAKKAFVQLCIESPHLVEEIVKENN